MRGVAFPTWKTGYVSIMKEFPDVTIQTQKKHIIIVITIFNITLKKHLMKVECFFGVENLKILCF